MKKRRTLGIIFFWMTLISPMVSFALASTIGEVNIFGVVGTVRYSWIMLLFIPIGILSILIGVKLKQNKEKFKRNFIIAFICLPLLVIFGSYRFIFKDIISYSNDSILFVEEKININLPDKLKVVSQNNTSYVLTYAKIDDINEKKIFELEILNDLKWIDTLSSSLKGSLPLNIQVEVELYEYYLVFNETLNSFEKESFMDGKCKIVFIGYDIEESRFIIIDNYEINIIN